jgi:hypothetical protein
MLIKKLDWNTYDIFVGEGWDNWIRVRVENDDVARVAGFPLSKHFRGVLKNRLTGE